MTPEAILIWQMSKKLTYRPRRVIKREKVARDSIDRDFDKQSSPDAPPRVDGRFQLSKRPRGDCFSVVGSFGEWGMLRASLL